MNIPDFYIITGGPGTGKTTLLRALEEEGIAVVPEAARQVIREQVKTGGNGLPWKNRERYTDLMLEASLRAYQETISNTAGLYFFDRGVPDALCYASMIGYTLSDVQMQSALSCIYNKTVFILPPWQEIYLTDNERKQSWKEAEETYHQLKNIYHRYTYRTIDVPVGSIAERKNFLLTHIQSLIS